MILLGIVLILWGAVSGKDGEQRLFAGLVIASLGGASSPCASTWRATARTRRCWRASAFVAVTVVALGLGPVKVWVLLVLGASVFAGTFYGMRELFKRRSGGLGFR